MEHAARHGAATRSTTARAATPTTCAAASPTRRSSTSTTATSAAPTRSRATRRSHLDPRPGLGDVRLRRAAGVPRHRADAELEPSAAGPRRGFMRKAARATCDFYIEQHRRRRHPLLGHRRPGPARAGRLASRARRSVQRPRAGRQLGRGHRRAGPAALGRTTCTEDEPAALLAGRPDGARHAARRAVPQRPTPNHQGLLLHTVYHRPNGWDYVPPGRQVPCGESSMWGDYHAREAALYVQRVVDDRARI